MKISLPYIKKINILTFLILFILSPSQVKSENLSIFTETPIIVNPESELEGFLIDLILDKMVYHYYRIPKDGIKKHNSTLFLSISDPSHGKIYSWKSGKFYGLMFMSIQIHLHRNFSDLIIRSTKTGNRTENRTLVRKFFSTN